MTMWQALDIVAISNNVSPLLKSRRALPESSVNEATVLPNVGAFLLLTAMQMHFEQCWIPWFLCEKARIKLVELWQGLFDFSQERVAFFFPSLFLCKRIKCFRISRA